MNTQTIPRLKLNEICHINQSSCLVETCGGYAIVQPDIRPVNGAKLLVSAWGEMQFAVVRGDALITDDGEAIEGEALEEVEVIGVVTFFVNGVNSYSDDLPVM